MYATYQVYAKLNFAAQVHQFFLDVFNVWTN
jgi:hypothetical protein